MNTTIFSRFSTVTAITLLFIVWSVACSNSQVRFGKPTTSKGVQVQPQTLIIPEKGGAAEDGSIPSVCLGGGASYSAATSIEHLVRRSDLVIVGRAGGLHAAIDSFSNPGIEATYQMDFAVHDIEVIQTVMGEAQPGENIQFGNHVGHCLEEGEVYILFLSKTTTYGKGYVDNASLLQNPAPYGFAGAFGPQVVWTVKDSKVFSDREESSPLGQQYSGVGIDAFLSEIKAAVDTITQPSHQPLSPLSPAKGDDSDGTTEPNLINPVDQPPGKLPVSPAKPEQRLAYEYATLEEIKAERGSVLLPAYVPEGYNLSEVRASFNKQVVYLTYRGPESGRILVVQGDSIGPKGVSVKPGHHKTVSIGGSTGVIVRGVWTYVAGSSSKELDWDPDSEATVMFELDGELIRIMAYPGKKWSDEEIVRIAESLQPY